MSSVPTKRNPTKRKACIPWQSTLGKHNKGNLNDRFKFLTL